jgi:hypothetical protein
LIVVGKKLVDLFLFVLALSALLINENENGQRQTDDRDHIAQELPRFESHDPSAKLGA